MIMIDENTSRENLLSAIYGNNELLDYCIEKNIDPEFMETEEIRNMVMYWIESGDETEGA